MIYGNTILNEGLFFKKSNEEKENKKEEKRLKSLSINEIGVPIKFIKNHSKIDQKFLDDLFDMYPIEAIGVALILGKYNDTDIIKFIETKSKSYSVEEDVIKKFKASNAKDIKTVTATDDGYVYYYNNKFLMHGNDIYTLSSLRKMGNQDIKENKKDYQDVAKYLEVNI